MKTYFTCPLAETQAISVNTSVSRLNVPTWMWRDCELSNPERETISHLRLPWRGKQMMILQLLDDRLGAGSMPQSGIVQIAGVRKIGPL